MAEEKSAVEQLQEANLELLSCDWQLRQLIRREDELRKERSKIDRKLRALFAQIEQMEEVNGE